MQQHLYIADMIEKNIDKFSELFKSCNIDDIIGDIPNIFAGNVSEDWMERFVDIMTAWNDWFKERLEGHMWQRN